MPAVPPPEIPIQMPPASSWVGRLDLPGAPVACRPARRVPGGVRVLVAAALVGFGGCSTEYHRCEACFGDAPDGPTHCFDGRAGARTSVATRRSSLVKLVITLEQATAQHLDHQLVDEAPLFGEHALDRRGARVRENNAVAADA